MALHFQLIDTYSNCDQAGTTIEQAVGFSSDILIESLKNAYIASCSATQFHPRTAPGHFFHHELVACTREFLLDQGWQIYSNRTMETVVNQDNTLALAFMLGDEYTGVKKGVGQPPSTVNKKGSIIIGAVERNDEFLFPELNEDVIASSSINLVTWVLLYHWKDNIVQAELSLPIKPDKSGYIRNWAERICLPFLSAIEVDVASDDTNNQEPEIEIILERKAQ